MVRLFEESWNVSPLFSVKHWLESIFAVRWSLVRDYFVQVFVYFSLVTSVLKKEYNLFFTIIR